MYMMFNIHANGAYEVDYEWLVEHYSQYVYLTESVWMVPGTVNPLD